MFLEVPCCSLLLCDRFDFDFPPLRGGHTCSIGSLSHKPARRRTIRNENHSLRHFAFLALKKTLAVVGANADRLPRRNADFLHVVRVHDNRADEGLVFGRIFADIDLLALFGGSTCIHEKTSGHERLSK
jgi:hypothetical protein